VSKRNMLVWDGDLPTDEEWSALELSTPITHFKLFSEQPVQVHRCEADGGIVLDSQSSIQLHLGHKIRQPVLIKRKEVMALVEGKIK